MDLSNIIFRVKSLFAIIGVFLLYTLLLSPAYYIFPQYTPYFILATIALIFLNVIHTSLSLVLQNRKLDFVEEPEITQYLQEELDLVAEKMDIKTPDVKVRPDYTMNASAMGLTQTTSQVQVTSELMSNLSQEELRATLAHELAHIKNRDILITYILYSPYRVVLLIDRWIINIFNNERASMVRVPLGFIHYVLYLLSLAILALIRLVSRQREYLADLKGAEITTPEVEIRKLRKISKYNAQLTPQDLDESREIMQQFSVDSDKLFSTHPSVSERVENINNTFFKD